MTKKKAKTLAPTVKCQVYETTDYDMFTSHEYQREVTGARLAKLVKSFETMVFIPPALVTPKYEIVDGNGRHAACRYLNIPFNYIVLDKMTLKEEIDVIKSVNSANTNWGPLQFENLYCTEGIQDYQTFQKFRLRYGFPVATCVGIAYIGIPGSGRRSFEFKHGLFKFKDYAGAVAIADHIKKFEIPYGDVHKSSSFVAAMIALWKSEGYDKFRMEKNLKRYANRVPIRKGVAGDILESLKKLYNFNVALKLRV